MASFLPFASLLFLSYASKSSALTCSKKETGEYEFFDGDQKVMPTNFTCMKGVITTPSTLNVFPPSAPVIPQFCRAVQDGIQKNHSKFEKVEVPTGMMCTYECREQPSQYGCVSKPIQDQCPCEKRKPHVVIKPVSFELGTGMLTGQNEVEGTLTCKDKDEGYQFPDAIPCMSIRADVTKRRVWFKKGSESKCRFKMGTKSETRFTEAGPTEVNLQGCMWVCKKAAPRCTELSGGDECNCKSPGLQKVLVGLEEEDVNGLVRQTKCEEDLECGQCGNCDAEGRCVLKEKAWEGNYCPCGEVCPSSNARMNPGGALSCMPNTKLLCMAEPKWDTSNGGDYKPGQFFLDYCSEGEVDAADSCGCDTVNNFREVLVWDEEQQLSRLECTQEQKQ